MHTPRLWVSLFGIVTLFSGHVSAQDFERGQIELTRQAVQSKRQEIVTNAMNLTDEESEKFCPVFRDWRAKNAGLDDRRVELVAQMDEAWGGMSEEQAQAILDEYMRIREDELKLQKQYIKRFRKILPHKKVTRFIQLENKMDAALNYNLAVTLPLLE